MGLFPGGHTFFASCHAEKVSENLNPPTRRCTIKV
nr:MAG TPA: hypothetical protein [Caudoviricetes sp.]